jgi:glutamine synthetase
MFDTAREALHYIAENDIAMVDLKMVGASGQWLHVTIPAVRFAQKHFEDGVGYDGSSGAGFAKVESGDVVALPQPATAFIDPFWEVPTISFLCDTVTADTKELYPGDPRAIAKRAVEFMKDSGIADEARMGPEFEFYVFDHVEVRNDPFDTGVSLRAAEVHPEGTAAAIPTRGGYMRVPPAECLHDLRSKISLILEELGIAVRYHHHEVGAPGQCEIEIDLANLVDTADRTMLIKYVIKNVARQHGKLATFMPKPIYGEAGNGMHVHQYLAKGGRNIFHDDKCGNYADLSDTALRYIDGLLTHGRALAGLANPSTNSFKRLVEGYEAPVNLFFSLANRSAAVRIPRYAVGPNEKRIEYRPPDFTGNIYLTLAAMLMAGLDGVCEQINVAPGQFGPFDVDIAEQDEAFRSRITPLPRSLPDALAALEQDHEFLLKGGVFTRPLIDSWIASKRAADAAPVAARPHPYEYHLYLDT